jgi:two-component system LytT family response regulator
MTALIVDDEPDSHVALKGLLRLYHPDIQVLASYYDIAHGLAGIREHQPELLLLDIELPDGLGFDLLKQLGKPSCWVVFITAHGHYARSAIRFGAIDFLTKPVTAEELGIALSRVREQQLERITIQRQIEILQEALRNQSHNQLPSLLAIHTQKGILYRRVADIIRLKADTNYTDFFFSTEPHKVKASVNLGEYEDQFLPYRSFMRVHRSHLVNLTFVESYVHEGGHLELKNGDRVIVSRSRREELFQRLKEI